MDQHQMSHESINYNKSQEDSLYDTADVRRGQSGKKYGSVSVDHRASASGRKHHATTRMNMTGQIKTHLDKHALARIQEEHALWLK